MNKNKLVTVISALGALVLIVAACAPAATPTPTATPTPPPRVATPTPTPGGATPTPTVGVATPTPAPEVGVYGQPITLETFTSQADWKGAQYGGILRIFGRTNPSHFDNQRTISWVVNAFVQPIYSQLVRFNPTKESMNPRDIMGDLAERWEISADELVYTFYLRKGVKWHNGAPFTAKDVKYSIEKLKDPKRSAFVSYFSAITRVEAVDDYTVKLYLSFPHGPLLAYFGMGVGSSILQERLKDVSYRVTAFAVGTGPFKLKSYTPGIEYVMEKNPDFFIKGLPFLDGISMRIISIDAAFMAWVAGELDHPGDSISHQSGLPIEKWEQAQKLAPQAVFRKTYGDPPKPQGSYIISSTFISFVKESPWQDVRVRKALSLITDNDALIVAGGGDLDNSEKMYVFPPPPTTPYGMTWDEVARIMGVDRPFNERLAEAKRLMAEAGYPNGFKGQIMSSDRASQGYTGRALYYQDIAKRYLNIDLSFYAPDRAVALDLNERGDFELTTANVTTNLGDPEEYLAFFLEANPLLNYGKYTHPRIEELFRLIQREVNFDKRLALVREAQRILIEDVPGYHASHGLNKSAYWPYVRGAIGRPFYSNFDHTGEWLEQTHPLYKKHRG